MRRLLSIIMFFSVVSVFAQTEESNKYFNQGMELYNQGQYTEAVPCFEKSDSIDKITLDSTSNRRDYSAMWLASCYYLLKDTIKARNLYTYYSQIPVNRNLTIQSDSLYEIASKLEKENNFEKAILYTKKASNLEKQNIGNNSLWYANGLCAISYELFKLQQYTDAINLLQEALKIKAPLLHAHHDIAIIQHWLSLINYTIGNFTDAIFYEEEALKTKRNLSYTKDAEYFSLKGNVVLFQCLLGNTEYALEAELELASAYKDMYGENDKTYVTMLNNIAIYYSQLGNKESALIYIKKTIPIIENILGKENETFFHAITNLLSIKNDLGYFEGIDSLGNETLKIIEKTIGCNNYDYVNLLSVLAQVKFKQGYIEDAIIMQQQIIDVRKNIHWGSLDDATSLRLMATYCLANKKYDNTIKLAIECTNMISNIVLNTFRNLTIAEQAIFWKKQNDWFFNILPNYAYRLRESAIICTLYDAILLSKGLLLNTEIEMKKALANNKDKTLLSIYNEILKYKNILENTSDEEQIQNIYDIIEKYEKILLARSTEYCDYTKKLDVKWQDVKNNLSEEDIAIEFIRIPVNENKIVYSAIILKKSMNVPVMVDLFEEKQLHKIRKDSLYLSENLFDLVWRPLLPYLKNINRIFFSPSGELYNIAVEYAYKNSNSNKPCSLYRLSSTKQLAIKYVPKSIKKVVLFGGINYDSKDVVNDNCPSTHTGIRSINIDSLNIRYGCQYLPETKEEVKEIKKQLTNLQIKSIKILTDTAGTEYSFKMLSGKNTDIIHIATHGFYWTENEAYSYNGEYKNICGGIRPIDAEDKALTRSGILFAGANTTLNKRKINIGANDGILTAKEIADMDLKGLDLIALSACQTGLGDISGEGVFGLQRGFKKAGANTLLMSLWKVDDKATKLLMSRFYSNIVAGKSKIESLRDAQKYVREYETEVEVRSDNKPAISAHAKVQVQQSNTQQKIIKKVHSYKDPKYWAAFILLDALN